MQTRNRSIRTIRALTIATSGLITVAHLKPAQGAVYVYALSGTTTDTWSAGTDWGQTLPPVSAATTELQFGFNSAVTSTTTTNDFSGSFQLNGVDLQGNANASTTTININSTSPSTGLSFVSNGPINPVVNLYAVLGNGSAASAYNVNAPIALVNDTTFQGNGTLQNFNFNGSITGSGRLIKTGNTVLVLAGTNNDTSAMVINGGAVQANQVVGLNSSSNLTLDGGVLQGSGIVSFTRTLGTGAGSVQFGTGGGGFAANGGVMTVQLNGGSGQVVWGSTASFLPSTAPLLFGSKTANNAVDFQNAIDLNGASRTVNVSAGSAKLSGVLSDGMGSGGGLTLKASGTLTLAASETYTGTTTVNGGTLMVGNGTTGRLNGTAGTDLSFSGTGTFIVDEAAASTQGMGALTPAAGDNNVQSTFVGTSATLTFANVAPRSNGAALNFITSGGTSSTNKIVLSAINNAIPSTGFIDPGIFFNGSNYASYDTTANAVTLMTYIGANAVTGTNATLGVNSSTQHVQYTANTTGSTFSGTATGGNNTLTAVSSTNNLFVGEVISGSSIPGGTYITSINSGASTVTISMPPSFNNGVTTITPYSSQISGQTTASLGSLKLNSTGGDIYIGSGQTLSAGGILRAGGTSGSTGFAIAGNLGNDSGAQLQPLTPNQDFVIRTDTTNDILAIGVPIIANGNNSLIKSGAGGLIFTSSNAYTGTTYVNGGALTLACSSGAAIPADLIINGGGVTPKFSGELNTSANVTVNGGAFTLSGSGITQTVSSYTQTNGTTTIAGSSNSGANVTVSGTSSFSGGTWSIGGGSNAQSTWTTGTCVISGGNNSINIASNQGPITLTVNLGGLEIDQPAGGGTFTALSINNFTSNTTPTASLALAAGSDLTYVANAANPTPTYIGVSQRQGYKGNLVVSLASGNHNFTIARGTSPTSDLAIQPNISGSGAITKAGAGVLELDGNDSYSGGTTISGGVLLDNLEMPGSTGTGTFATTSTTVTVSSTSGLFVGEAVSGTGVSASITAIGTGTITISANTTAPSGGSGNALTYSGRSSIPGGIATTILTPGSINAGSIVFNNTGGVLGLGAANFSRALGTGSVSVQFLGDGGFAAYNADRTVNLGGGSASLTWASTANFLADGKTLLLGASTADHTVEFQNPINFNTAIRTVQVDRGFAAIDATLSGALTNGGLTKTGAGILQLTNSGDNYTGVTTIQAGTLKLADGSTNTIASSSNIIVGDTSANSSAILDVAGLASNTITIAAGKQLSGHGTVAGGNVSISSGATISPGNSIGSLSISAGNLSLSGNYNADIDTSANGVSGGAVVAGASDLINITGSATLDNTDSNLNLSLISVTPGANTNIYVLIATTGGVTGQFANVFPLPDGGLLGYQVFYKYDPATGLDGSGNDVAVQLSSVPEPGCVSLLAIGALGLLGRRRRHSTTRAI